MMILEQYKEIISEKNKNLEELGYSLKNEYSSSDPYPHIEIDNLFCEKYLNLVYCYAILCTF